MQYLYITTNREELLEDLRDFLLDEYREGKETVLIIDEAQLLSSQLFEFIRVLSNFETDKQKILHIILFAQPEIVERLGEPAMRYLAQRITVIYRLKALSEDEIFLYIHHRLLRAGSRGFVQFTDDAVKEIYRTSQGCPRLINVLGDRCLLYLYSHSKRIVDGPAVRAVLKEESQILMRKETKKYRKTMYAHCWLHRSFLAGGPVQVVFGSHLQAVPSVGTGKSRMPYLFPVFSASGFLSTNQH